MTEPAAQTVQIRVDQGCHRLLLTPPLNLPAALALKEAAEEPASSGQRVAVDFGGAEHLHGAVLQVLLAIRAKVAGRGGVFETGAAHPALRACLQRCGAGDLLSLEAGGAGLQEDRKEQRA